MKKFLERQKLVVQIVLNEQKYYFPGDHVLGRIVLVTSKSTKLKGIRLVWTGTVRIYLSSNKQDEHVLFKETCQVPGTNEVPEPEPYPRPRSRQPASISAHFGPLKPPTHGNDGIMILEANQQYEFPFDAVLPTDTSLPSCTESESSVGGIIQYTIQAFLDRPAPDFSATKAQINVPVLERIHVQNPQLQEPQFDQIACPVPLSTISNGAISNQAVMKVSIPKTGYTRNESIPVTVDITHVQPYRRPQGISIALTRVCTIICRERSYELADAIVHHIKADVDLMNEPLRQTISRSLLIPKIALPTVSYNARLMLVDYKIVVKAQLQDVAGNEPSPVDYVTLSCMKAEIPVVIGTLPTGSDLPPDVLDPKFVKSVEHVRLQQQRRTDSIRAKGTINLFRNSVSSHEHRASVIDFNQFAQRPARSSSLRPRLSSIRLSLGPPFEFPQEEGLTNNYSGISTNDTGSVDTSKIYFEDGTNKFEVNSSIASGPQENESVIACADDESHERIEEDLVKEESLREESLREESLREESLKEEPAVEAEDQVEEIEEAVESEEATLASEEIYEEAEEKPQDANLAVAEEEEIAGDGDVEEDATEEQGSTTYFCIFPSSDEEEEITKQRQLQKDAKPQMARPREVNPKADKPHIEKPHAASTRSIRTPPAVPSWQREDVYSKLDEISESDTDTSDSSEQDLLSLAARRERRLERKAQVRY
ncbi:hypothetical protein EC973_001574 [Apophysomyces ossiformis]|uniref:Arrestin C-terminal-like domain-containing protein n=1 Tax=Apophysomyces ossiformis TaxID=679940 RepID=A0A8H7EP77_9FUNG|nr:hypothetical protein EC973_001574 [Apophysomyces ossiformis]